MSTAVTAILVCVSFMGYVIAILLTYERLSRRSQQRCVCPNCNWIGDPTKCSCMWTVHQVAEGRGTDPEVVNNAKTILEMAQVKEEE